MELKKLYEQRIELAGELEKVLDNAKVEERAMSEEENTKFNEIESKIKAIDSTISCEERARDLKMDNINQVNKVVEERAVTEEKVFANYIRGVVEERADVNMTIGDNGAVIPTTIANKIIKKVVDICPIYQMATKYNIKGTLNIPYYDESTGSITMAYADDFIGLTSTSSKTTTIALNGFLAGVLTKISKTLVNNSQFDIVTYVVNDMAEKVSIWIEKELLNGTTGKVDGLKGVTQLITAASTTAIIGDELIKLKDKIKDVYQNNACWIMSSNTRTALRLLKDGNQRYLFNDDVTSPFGTTLLGKPVYVSDNMADIGTGKTVIYYGDFSGLAVKISENISIDVLREKYATEHAVGVVGYMEIDAKVENAQKIAKLVMA